MKRSVRLLPALLVLLVASAPAVYYQMGFLVYSQVAATDLECTNHAPYNTPDSFEPHLYPEQIDEYTHTWNDTIIANIDDYFMTSWENTTIHLTDEPISLSAWYVEQQQSAPWVIIIHGIRSCKANHEVLIPAGMLVNNGFNVLMIDLRDHWESTVEDELVSAGQREWRDVHAAWSWLQTEKNVSAEQIGLFGASMGAGTAAITFAQEPLIRAAFLDSVYYSMDTILAEELEFQGFPSFLKNAGIFAGKVHSGDDLIAIEPYEAAMKADDRWMYIAYNTLDTRIRAHHGESMCEMAIKHTSNATCWSAPSSVQFVDGDGETANLAHVTLMLTQPVEYELRLVDFFNAALNSGA